MSPAARAYHKQSFDYLYITLNGIKINKSHI